MFLKYFWGLGGGSNFGICNLDINKNGLLNCLNMMKRISLMNEHI